MQLFPARLLTGFLALLLVACAAVATIAPAFAATAPLDGQLTNVQAPAEGAPTAVARHAIEPMVLWSVAAIAGGGLLLSVFYLLKRKVGGFPEHPAWVAPITIMPSKNFADEGTFGPGDSGHAADAHH